MITVLWALLLVVVVVAVALAARESWGDETADRGKEGGDG